MDAFCERNRTEEIPKNVFILLDVDLPKVWTNLDAILHPFVSIEIINYGLTVPVEMQNHNTSDMLMVDICLIFALLADCFSQSDLLVLRLFNFLLVLFLFQFFLVLEVLVKEQQNLIFVPVFHALLEFKHLVTNFIANLNSFVFVLEFFP
jgi:hypothetical protein